MVEEDIAKELELAKEEELRQISGELDRIEEEWSRSKSKARSKQSLSKIKGSTDSKRQGTITDDNKKGGRSPKKMKYSLRDRNWGTKSTGEPSCIEEMEHNKPGESTSMEQPHISPPQDTQLPSTPPPNTDEDINISTTTPSMSDEDKVAMCEVESTG